jgi:hypothetical protein
MNFGDGEAQEGLLVKSMKGIAMEDIKGNMSLKLTIELFCRNCECK